MRLPVSENLFHTYYQVDIETNNAQGGMFHCKKYPKQIPRMMLQNSNTFPLVLIFGATSVHLLFQI